MPPSLIFREELSARPDVNGEVAALHPGRPLDIDRDILDLVQAHERAGDERLVGGRIDAIAKEGVDHGPGNLELEKARPIEFRQLRRRLVADEIAETARSRGRRDSQSRSARYEARRRSDEQSPGCGQAREAVELPRE